MPGCSTLHGETDVDQEITTAAGNEKRRRWRKDDSDLAVGGKGKLKLNVWFSTTRFFLGKSSYMGWWSHALR